MTKKMQGNLMLLLTSFIWGTAFVAQSVGMDYIGPFTYNCVRTLIGSIVLIPVIFLFDMIKPDSQRLSRSEQKIVNKNSIIGGIYCGVILCIASCFQQYGVSMTTSGKAGFITALYIVIVPLLGIFIKKKIPKVIWLCVAIAVGGFYLLCVKENFYISTGDILVLICAFFFSLHIMVIDYFNEKNVDGVRMSCVQFFIAGIMMFILMMIFEEPQLKNIWQARNAILYTGVMSCGVAYTFQILGQKNTNPTTSTLIMSLESVFAALSGWIILNESLSLKEIIGCVLVFVAVILAQIPLSEKSE